MHSNALPPKFVARISKDVYALNEGDEEAIKLFLNNPAFATQKDLTAKVGGHVLRAAKDGFGACATGKGSFENHLFLIFRGTTAANNKADFVTDARIGLTRSNSNFPVHIGFSHTFKSMQRDIEQFVAAHKEQKKPINGVHCIGHSLGGAIATLAAEWAYNNVSKNVKLYSFGQPRVGLTLFSSSFTRKLGKENIFRVFHSTDPVPMVPVFPYVHSPLPGLGYRILSDQLITSGESHRMDTYIADVAGKNWSELEKAAPVFNHEHAIEEWLQSNANQNPNCPKTFEWLEKAIIWLLKKTLAKVVNVAQLAIMGIHTFVDKLAWALSKGMEMGESVSKWVKLFMEKIMRILRIPKSRSPRQARSNFFKYLLNQLIRRANQLAAQAVKSIGRG